MSAANEQKLHRDVEKILFSTEELDRICRRLGEEISRDYKGKELYVISILKGAFVFLADLTRYITEDINIDFMAVSTYKDKTESSGRPQIRLDLSADICGKDVLIVEDILDSGVTLFHVRNLLLSRNPNSIKI
ncbi:MAG: hypoxanthine phosphoribosyltransferase, partial [Clostridia bacterium]|nr:hypoxanthine phosphoribosyltransferase [Clostridia bacterium]